MRRSGLPRAERVLLGGIPVDLMVEANAVHLLLETASSADGPPLAVMSANLDHIHHFGARGAHRGTPFAWAADAAPADPRQVRWLCLLDGAPLVTRARRLTGTSWPRLAGSDLIGPVLDAAEMTGTTVGFLGGSPATQDALRLRLAVDRPALRVVGWWAPERGTLTDPAASGRLAADVRLAAPQILVVGLGKPRQEEWIVAYGGATGAPVLLAFGAVVDFLAGRVRRAPRWLARLHLEWAWRLLLEPRRLARRYLVQGPPAYLELRRSSRVLPTPAAGNGR